MQRQDYLYTRHPPCPLLASRDVKAWRTYPIAYPRLHNFTSPASRTVTPDTEHLKTENSAWNITPSSHRTWRRLDPLERQDTGLESRLHETEPSSQTSQHQTRHHGKNVFFFIPSTFLSVSQLPQKEKGQVGSGRITIIAWHKPNGRGEFHSLAPSTRLTRFNLGPGPLL